MQTIRFRDRTAYPRNIKVGVQLDNGVEKIAFELPQIADGQIATLYWINGEHADAELLADGVWTVANTMTQYPGEALCFVVISDGDELLWHSEVFVAEVAGIPDAEGTIEQVYPSAIQAGVEAAAASAEDAAESAAAAAASAASIGEIYVDNETNRLIITGGAEE